MSVRQQWTHLALARCSRLHGSSHHPSLLLPIRRHATSSSSSSPSPNLKPLLRQLYLKVHPDLFDAYPAEKEVNSGSFIALNDYLAAIAQRKQLRGKPVQLTFYKHTASPTPATTPPAPTATPTAPPAAQPLDKVSVLFPTDFYSRSSTTLTSLAVKQIHDNLTALFGALGITTPLHLPADLSSAAAASAASEDSGGSDEADEHSWSVSTVSLPHFLASVATTAQHIAHTTATTTAQHALRSAHLRLQGVRTLWQQAADGAPVGDEAEAAIERRFEAVIRRVPRLCAGLKVGLDEADEAEVAGEEGRRREERRQAEEGMGVHDESGEPHNARRGSPMSQQAGMPFSRLLSQIRRAQGDGEAEDEAEKAEQAKPRSPLLSTTTVFSFTAPQSHVDNRGRLVLSIFETDEQWFTFLSQPSLFTVAESRAAAYHSCKSIEQRLAQQLTVHDLYAESGLVGSDEYGAYLTLLQSAAHQLHRLFRRHPELQSLSVRVQSADTAMAVDDVQGVLLVPLHTSPAELVALYETRGHEALRLLHRHTEARRRYEAAVNDVRRRYRLRRLDRVAELSEAEMLECCVRLSSATSATGGGLFRVHFDGLDVTVGREYRVEPESGRVTIPWNFVMHVEGERQQRY